MGPRDLAPLALVVALLTYEWLLWRFAGRAVARGYRNMVLAYIGRVVILTTYVAAFSVDLPRYLVADATGGILLALLVILPALVAFRHRFIPVVKAVRTRMRDVAVWAAYVTFAVALVEELIFRGALLLAVGADPLAYFGSAAATAVWHVPYYLRQWPDRWRSMLWQPFASSLVLGTTAIVSGSLWAPILLHAASDIVGNLWRFAPPSVSVDGTRQHSSATS